MQDSPIGPAGENGERNRRDERDSLFVLARIRPEGAETFETVRVRNVSSGGLMAQVTDGYPQGLRVEVELEGVGRVDGSVAWAEAGRVGIAFDHPVDKSRARKQGGKADAELFRHQPGDTRRPSMRPR